MKPLRVLYIHHAGPFGGASRSLFELIHSFAPNTVQPFVVTRRGQFQELLEKSNIPTLGSRGIAQFDNTRYSHYRNWRWLVLLRELVYLPTTLHSLWSARKLWSNFDLVHINDLTLLPAIWLAKRLFKCPVVVHVRSVQNPLTGWRGKLIRAVLQSAQARLIAIDQTVQASLPGDLHSTVIHNGLRINPSSNLAAPDPTRIFTAGMVGGLSRAKGCLEFIEAAGLCKKQGVSARFVFVGQSMRKRALLRDTALKLLGLSQEIEDELNLRIKQLGLEADVEFWPFTTDLAAAYAQFNVVCFPSHFDAPGRPIFEAALFGIPSIAAISQAQAHADTIQHGITGLTIEAKNPQALANAIELMQKNPEQRLAMGRNAARLAQDNFDIHKNAAEVLAIYQTRNEQH